MKGPKSSKILNADEVVDENGKRRFHGAFTGGFSAGYFNTVGSAEGFKPTEFVSSKSNRSKFQTRSSLDYMDDEDGLLGKKLETKDIFDTFDSKINNAVNSSEINSGQETIPNLFPKELIVASGNPIGKMLLKKLGWKEGQGIGPRVRNKKESSKDTNKNIEFHPGANIQTIHRDAWMNGDITFAPENTINQASMPIPKYDITGIGYKNSNEDENFMLQQNILNDNIPSSKRYKVSDIYDKNSNTSGNKSHVKGFSGFSYDYDDDDDVYSVHNRDLNLVDKKNMEIQLTEEDFVDNLNPFSKDAMSRKRKELNSDFDSWLNNTIPKGYMASTNNTTTSSKYSVCPSDGRYALTHY